MENEIWIKLFSKIILIRMSAYTWLSDNYIEYINIELL